jgi:hypothetical protein
MCLRIPFFAFKHSPSYFYAFVNGLRLGRFSGALAILVFVFVFGAHGKFV